MLRTDLPLQPGYLITVEPGIYFIPALLTDAARREKFADAVKLVLEAGTLVKDPPKPPTSAVDSGQYNLGKDIYSGKAKLGQASATTATTQAARLKDLQAKLPKSAQKTVNLPELAGKLDAAQLSALEYYLEVRYQVK